MKIKFVGDTFLKTRDGKDPFEKVDLDSDILFMNLETALTHKTSRLNIKSAHIRTNPENIAYLKRFKTVILNLANNHLFDFGERGAVDTFNTLREAGITSIGTSYQRSTIIRNDKIKVGFISAYHSRISGDHLAIMHISEVSKLITKLKPEVDFLIVSLHWGIEHTDCPAPYQQRQARRMIDQGADLIVGHHPHVVQGYENYKGKYIYYSLGNFNFCHIDSEEGADERRSFVLEINIDEKTLRYARKHLPVKISSNYQPLADPSGDLPQRIIGDIHFIPWYSNYAGVYLSSNLQSWRIRIKKGGVLELIKMVAWLTLKPFNYKCYLGLMFKLFIGSKKVQENS